LKIVGGAAEIHIVEGVDAIAIGAVHHLGDALRRVPLAHGEIEVAGVVGEAVERVRAENEAADPGIAEIHFGHLRERTGLAGGRVFC
jgi:hypothetical protein